MATEKNILVPAEPGFQELAASLRATAINDVLSFEFEDQFAIEDIVVNVSSSQGYEVYLVYPSTLEFKLVDTTSTAWFLNVPNGQGKNWYRMPAKSKIKILVDSAVSSAVLFTMSVLGRGGG